MHESAIVLSGNVDDVGRELAYPRSSKVVETILYVVEPVQQMLEVVAQEHEVPFWMSRNYILCVCMGLPCRLKHDRRWVAQYAAFTR